jgi:hypothetical protein
MAPFQPTTELDHKKSARSRGITMAQESKADAIAEYYRRASEARRMAETATDPIERTDFLAIERRWLSLARDHASASEDQEGSN